MVEFARGQLELDCGGGNSVDCGGVLFDCSSQETGIHWKQDTKWAECCQYDCVRQGEDMDWKSRVGQLVVFSEVAVDGQTAIETVRYSQEIISFSGVGVVRW